MELNGTWYAKDCIKEIGKILPNDSYFYFPIWVVIGNDTRYQDLRFTTKELAEQSRKELIKKLEK